MIRYERGGIHFFTKVFQRRGSVFPVSLRIALPCSILSSLLRLCVELGYFPMLESKDGILKDNSCWSGFMFLVGFLIVFRTSTAYARFWDGCTSTHRMRAEWFDACSALVAFTKYSKHDNEVSSCFQHTLVRLFSMLHAVALGEIEDSSSYEIDTVAAFKYPLLDAAGIDAESLMTVKSSDSKVELVFQWIQQLIVENIDNGVLTIPAPILSRAFHELANGMVAFHEAIKISTIPFPFPYAQTCDCLLMLHWIVTPFINANWASNEGWAFLFTFIQVFIYWSLNAIAVEIENPFGDDANDIDAAAMQIELNQHLRLLLRASTKRTPLLSNMILEPELEGENMVGRMESHRHSLTYIWSALASQQQNDDSAAARSVRCHRISVGSTNSSRRASIISNSSILDSLSSARRAAAPNMCMSVKVEMDEANGIYRTSKHQRSSHASTADNSGHPQESVDHAYVSRLGQQCIAGSDTDGSNISDTSEAVLSRDGTCRFLEASIGAELGMQANQLQPNAAMSCQNLSLCMNFPEESLPQKMDNGAWWHARRRASAMPKQTGTPLDKKRIRAAARKASSPPRGSLSAVPDVSRYLPPTG